MPLLHKRDKTCTPLPSGNKAAHSGFETHRRRHQKSKTGYQWPHKKDLCPPNFFKKNTKQNDTAKTKNRWFPSSVESFCYLLCRQCRGTNYWAVFSCSLLSFSSLAVLKVKHETYYIPIRQTRPVSLHRLFCHCSRTNFFPKIAHLLTWIKQTGLWEIGVWA